MRWTQAAALCHALVFAACGQAQEQELPGAEGSVERSSYQIGFGVASLVRGDAESYAAESGVEDFDIEAFKRGMAAGSVAGEPDRAAQDAYTAWIQDVQEWRMAQLEQRHEEEEAELQEVAAENRAAGAAFLEKNGAREGVATLASGIQVEVLKSGYGARPTVDSTVKVHYRGKLLDDREFDNSYDRGEPLTIPLKSVIQGWTLGMVELTVGAKAILYIPSEYGYGDQSIPGGPDGEPLIPAGSLLKFEVELLEIVN